LEGVGLETHVHKITNVTVFIWYFDSGHWQGWALKYQLFLAQMELASLVALSGSKKVSISGPPIPMALVMDIARIQIITSCAIETTGTLTL
jgi:hypothetical protein